MGFAGGRRPGSMSEPLARGAVVWGDFSPKIAQSFTAGTQNVGTCTTTRHFLSHADAVSLTPRPRSGLGWAPVSRRSWPAYALRVRGDGSGMGRPVALAADLTADCMPDRPFRLIRRWCGRGRGCARFRRSRCRRGSGGERGHARELPVGRDVGGRGWGGSPARAVVAAVDPDRVQTRFLGGDVVVEQALGDVQELAFGDAEPPCLGQQRIEVPGRGLVGADVLGRQDTVEGHCEQLVAAGERCPVDVGQDNQLEMLCEGNERGVRVAERGPVGYGHRQAPGVVGGDLGPEFLPERGDAAPENVWIERCRMLRLCPLFLLAVCGQERFVVEREPAGSCPSAENRGDSRFPVDERSVAVETERFELGDLHETRSLMAESPNSMKAGPISSIDSWSQSSIPDMRHVPATRVSSPAPSLGFPRSGTRGRRSPWRLRLPTSEPPGEPFVSRNTAYPPYNVAVSGTQARAGPSRAARDSR